MNTDLKIKIGFIAFLLALCGYALWPSVQRYSIEKVEFEKLRQTDPARYQELNDKALHLGLDLQGGMHLVLGVRTEEVLDKELEGLVNDVKDWLGRDQIPFLEARKSGQILEVAFASFEELEKGRERLTKAFGDGFTLTSRAEANRQILVIQASADYVRRTREDAFNQVMETLRNRVDQLGVAEPSIQRQGMTGHNILIQLPGLKDPDQAKRVIGKVAALDFRIVLNSSTTKEALTSRFPGGCPDTDGADQKEIYTCPDGSVILPGEMPSLSDLPQRGYYHLEGNLPASGRDLESASTGVDQYGKPSVQFSIKSASSEAFGRLTRDNLGKQMAIILDSHVKSAPTLQGRITRSGEITGSFTPKESYELALTLRSGALPASVEILEERSVGASLGDDSIRQGTIAYLLGALAVVVFMIFYYRASGIIAVICLSFTMLLILAALAAFGATLTMPGIAGLVLTLGMGVDANVVIFERMRDELRLGRTVRASIAAGYEKAFSAIADSNIATLIAAFVLLQYGSGPVRGFGVTLAIGIAASLFSALVVSRLLFDLITRSAQDFKLRFRVFVENTSIDFFRWRKTAIATSLAIIAAGIVAMVLNRGVQGSAMNWGIDFSGGSLLQVQFEKPIDIGQVRSILEKAGYETTIQQFGEENELLIRTFSAEDTVAQAKIDLEKKIRESIKVPFDTHASHAELLLVPGADVKIEDLKAAVDALQLGNNVAVSIDTGKVRLRISEVTARILRDLRAHYEAEGLSPEKAAAGAGFNRVIERRTELVGPQVGEDLKQAALWAMGFAVIATLIYLSIRFEFPYALGAVVASFHDAVMILAFFAIFRWEVDLTIVAALLTILGYSLNDTIVIFDRVRENQKRFRREGFIKLINESLNETLSRTILTSLTTFMTTLSLLLFGGQVISGFATAMVIGIVAGSYSTIYIASPVVYYWGIWQENRHARAGKPR